MNDLLTAIIGGLTGGLTNMAQGLGQGLNALVTDIFVTTTTQGAKTLSDFGAIIVIFAGVGLAVGLSRFVVNLFRRFGK